MSKLSRGSSASKGTARRHAQARRTRSPGALVVAGEAVAQAHSCAAVLAVVAVDGGELVPAAGRRAARPLVHLGVVCGVTRLRYKVSVVQPLPTTAASCYDCPAPALFAQNCTQDNSGTRVRLNKSGLRLIKLVSYHRTRSLSNAATAGRNRLSCTRFNDSCFPLAHGWKARRSATTSGRQYS